MRRLEAGDATCSRMAREVARRAIAACDTWEDVAELMGGYWAREARPDTAAPTDQADLTFDQRKAAESVLFTSWRNAVEEKAKQEVLADACRALAQKMRRAGLGNWSERDASCTLWYALNRIWRD